MKKNLFSHSSANMGDSRTARSVTFRTVVILFVLLLALESFLQYENNRSNSYATTAATISNIQEVVVKNEENIQTLSDTLNEEYKVRAKAVAYTLSISDKQFEVSDYRRIARAMEIDEIHIFDVNGRIVAGSEPKYWGMSFDSGEQIAYFKPILSDYDLVMCQDVTPNTAEARQMMYAICWMEDHSGIVQIGISPERLLEEMNQSGNLISQISFADDGILASIVDSSTHALVASSDAAIIGSDHTCFEELFGPLVDQGKRQYRTKIEGTIYYVSAACFDGYYIAAAQSAKIANRGLVASSLILGSALLASIVLILQIQRKSNALEKKQRALVQKSNEALAENNDIIADANIGIWHIFLFDGEKPRMRANPKMRELLCLPEDMTDEEAIYESWHARIAPDALSAVEASVTRMLSGVKSENTYLWNHPSLGPQYVRCGGTAQKVEGKGFILRGYHYNVTEEVLRDQNHELELSLALKDAQQANVAKTTFLNNMSHDIRTPMNAIIGYTNIAKKQNHDPEVAVSLEKISGSSEHLLSLINDVLDISRIESGKITFDPKPVDLRVVIDDVLAIARGNLEGRELQLTEDCHAPYPYVLADALRLREIMLNILSNAIKFTPDGGAITFSSNMIPEADRRQVTTVITISDTGIGMSSDFLEHIFDEFSQERSDARTQYKGTGLGMSIVKRYVALMGGTIQVESKKGVGSTFRLCIPMELSDTVAAVERPVAHDNVDLRGLHALLAEDNELNAEIAQVLLEELGITVTWAEDGQKAVQAYLSSPPGTFDLILMDIMMPVMNGYEASIEIRKYSREVPIIAMTANTFAEDVQAAFDAGMNGHIPKPVSAEEIKRVIARCLKR